MYRESFKAREDLEEFGDNALLLFSLILKYGYEDISAIASEALTDGHDDKKADLVLVDPDGGNVVIAQGYFAQNENKPIAPSNKASDLNTAISWLLNREIEELPINLQSPAIELRNALEDNLISNFEIWYVHNLPESKNCQDELNTVEQTANSIIKLKYPKITNISIKAIEVGNNTLSEWYKMTQTPILVNDKLEFSVPGGFDTEGGDWKAITTSIRLKDLYKLFNSYSTKIFSANIRDYLGSRKSDSNINNNIKLTAKDDPDKFCVYNNGITAITHDYTFNNKDKKLIVNGLSIVNGAQTTGSIGTLDEEPDDNSLVSARFIKCTNPDTILNIVRFNNSQNKITATDFRSNDPIQERLRLEFNGLNNYTYLGGRRGGAVDSIKRQSNLLPSDSVAQAIAAFHGRPDIAYNQKSDIWNKDAIYSKFFNEYTNANHIILTYSLFLAIKELKLSLFNKLKKEEELLELDSQKLDFLRLRGANYILISAIASCLESISGKKIPNLFKLSFKKEISLKNGVDLWNKIINITIPFSSQLKEPTKKSLKVINENENSINMFKSLVQSTICVNQKIYDEFNSNLLV